MAKEAVLIRLMATAEGIVFAEEVEKLGLKVPEQWKVKTPYGVEVCPPPVDVPAEVIAAYCQGGPRKAWEVLQGL